MPSGKVLGTLLGMKITQGALIEGIEKALTFEGLMMLSKASIAPGLKLPGRLGRIVAAAFVYYDRIVEYKGRIKAASLSRDADDLMLRVWGFAETAFADAAFAETTGAEKAKGGPSRGSDHPGSAHSRRLAARQGQRDSRDRRGRCMGADHTAAADLGGG